MVTEFLKAKKRESVRYEELQEVNWRVHKEYITNLTLNIMKV